MTKQEVKNRLTGKIIFEYSKENNTVAETIKEFIKQELSKGNGYADLSAANLDKRYISISRIGSQKRMTTYCFEDDIIWCGCFKGTLKEFEVRVKETHKDNARYLKEYIGFIKYLKALK